RITLFIFGGVAQIGGEAQKPAHEFRIAVAGPLASLFIAGCLAAISRAVHPNAGGLAGIADHGGLWGNFALVNLALALFNLIPAFPLDGGRLLRAGLWGGLRDRARATRWASNLGKAFAFAMMGAGGAIAGAALAGGDPPSAWPGVWYVVLGYFLFTIAGTAGRLEGGATPRRPGQVDDEEEPVRPPEAATIVRTHEGQTAEPDARGGSARSGERARPARTPRDQPGDGAR